MRLTAIAAFVAGVSAEAAGQATILASDGASANLTLATHVFANCVGTKSENLYVGVSSAGHIYVQAYEPQHQLLPQELFGCVSSPEHASDIHLVTGATEESNEQVKLSGSRGVLSGVSSGVRVDAPAAQRMSQGYTVGQVLTCPDSDACSGRTNDGGGQAGVCYNATASEFKSAGLWTYICSGYLAWTVWPTGPCGTGNNHTALVPAGKAYCMRHNFSSYRLDSHGSTC